MVGPLTLSSQVWSICTLYPPLALHLLGSCNWQACSQAGLFRVGAAPLCALLFHPCTSLAVLQHRWASRSLVLVLPSHLVATSPGWSLGTFPSSVGRSGPMCYGALLHHGLAGIASVFPSLFQGTSWLTTRMWSAPQQWCRHLRLSTSSSQTTGPGRSGKECLAMQHRCH